MTDNETTTEVQPAEVAVEEEKPKRGRPPKARCPECGGDVVEHGDESPFKVGAIHCNDCGGCFIDGKRR